MARRERRTGRRSRASGGGSGQRRPGRFVAGDIDNADLGNCLAGRDASSIDCHPANRAGCGHVARLERDLVRIAGRVASSGDGCAGAWGILMSVGAIPAATALGAQMPPPAVAMGATVYGPAMVQQNVAAIAAAQREKEAAQAPVYAKMKEDVAKDQARVDKMQADYTPVEVTRPPPPPENDPLKGFVSAAGIFAMLASALTHTPAINAMNGMASAINATKANDWKAYEEGYKQWKENTDLAIEKHKLQAADMQAALEKMQTDLSTGVAMAKAVAASADDRIATKLLEEGEYEKLSQHMQASAAAAAAMQEHQLRIIEELPRAAAAKAITAAIASGKPEDMDAAIRLASEVSDPVAFLAQQREGQARAISADPASYKDGKLTDDAFRKMMAIDPTLAMNLRKTEAEHLGQPSEYRWPDGKTKIVQIGGNGVAYEVGTHLPVDLAGASKVGAESRGGVAGQQIADVKADVAKQHPEYTPGQLDTAANNIIAVSKKVPGTSMTAFTAEHAADYEKTFIAQNGRPPTPEELGSYVATVQGKQVLNANQLNTLEDRAQQFKLALDQVQKIKELLPKAVGIATRLGQPLEKIEAVGNMLGADSATDRADFESALEFLRNNAPLLLKQANPTSRAIAGDQAMVDKIIRGEGWGDSRANVQAAMDNLNSIFQQDLSIMQNQARRSGRTLNLPGLTTPLPGATPAAPAPAAPWATDPLVLH